MGRTGSITSRTIFGCSIIASTCRSALSRAMFARESVQGSMTFSGAHALIFFAVMMAAPPPNASIRGLEQSFDHSSVAWLAGSKRCNKCWMKVQKRANSINLMLAARRRSAGRGASIGSSRETQRTPDSFGATTHSVLPLFCRDNRMRGSRTWRNHRETPAVDLP